MKNIIKTLNFISVLLLVTLSTYAQKKDSSFTYAIQKMENKIVVGSSNAFMEFQKGTFLGKDSIPLFIKSKLRMSSKDEIRHKKSEFDEIGFEHIRYQHYYDGIPVEGSEYIAHLKNSELISANGKLSEKISIKSNSKKKAPKINLGVLKEVCITLEDFAKNTPEVIVLPVEIKDSVLYKLCHKYSLSGDLESQNIFAYIDAETGDVIKTISRIQNCTVGTVNTLYNGSQSISTSLTGGNYVLNANCNNRKISVTSIPGTVNGNNLPVPSAFTGAVFSDSDNIWSSTDNVVRTGASVFWGLQKSYDYFLSVHNRNSFNNSGAQINGFIYNSTLPNAAWFAGAFYFEDGDGISFNSVSSIDVIGHEFTHAVTQFTANLTYANESGALNESFSDIFGDVIENYATNGGGDYKHGFDYRVCPGLCYYRSLSNPKSTGHPDTYKGINWNPASNGVHENSGVQNHWYYILSEGKGGVNDNNIAYQVSGIGRDKAALIAMRNLQFYLTSSSGYREAMKGSIRAAKDLYGSCSVEAIQTAKAWEAVGLLSFPLTGGSPPTSYNVTGTQSLNNYTTVYYVSNVLSSSQNIPSGAEVVYTGGNQVRLLPGFRANQGSRVRIYNTGCDYDLARKENVISSDSSKINSVKTLGEEFEVYPNPSSSEITIKSEQGTIQQLTIFNLYGSIVYKSELETNSHSVNISQFNEGIYFINVKVGDKLQTKKLIVKK